MPATAGPLAAAILFWPAWLAIAQTSPESAPRYPQQAAYTAPGAELPSADTPLVPARATGAPLPLTPRGDGPLRMVPRQERDGAQPRRLAGGTASLITVGGSLALVLGLFFVVAWMFRRNLPASAQLLPGEVVEVLGRTTLANRQQAHLIRCGNKLLLVALTATGADTLTEITDPVEVDRLAGLCRQSHPHSATSAFRHALQQFAGERPGKKREAADV